VVIINIIIDKWIFCRKTTSYLKIRGFKYAVGKCWKYKNTRRNNKLEIKTRCIWKR